MLEFVAWLISTHQLCNSRCAAALATQVKAQYDAQMLILILPSVSPFLLFCPVGACLFIHRSILCYVLLRNAKVSWKKHPSVAAKAVPKKTPKSKTPQNEETPEQKDEPEKASRKRKTKVGFK